jgi:hypothetical protein
MPIQPFVVAVKTSAIERNERVRDLVDGREQRVEYESRAAAEDAAESFSAEGSPVRLQRLAPQDDTDADAYLVGAARYDPLPRRGPAAEGWTFAVGSDEYGALGETVLTAGSGVTRPIQQFVSEDLNLDRDLRERDDDDPLEIAVDDNPERVTLPGESGAWHPDLRIGVTFRGVSVIAYDCEVKTGDGDIERNQERIIERVADERHVVLARVDVSGLPQTFSVSFETYGTTPALDSEESLEGADLPLKASGSLPVESPQRTIDDW